MSLLIGIATKAIYNQELDIAIICQNLQPRLKVALKILDEGHLPVPLAPKD